MRIISPDYERAANIFKRLLLVAFTVFSTQFALAAEENSGGGTCEEILSSLETISFDSIFEGTERHPALAPLAPIYKSRTPEQQSAIDEQLTEDHLRKEMSFQTRNPLTGMYDKFVAVPVNGHIAPILKKDFDRMVKSTGPVLRALRALLQKAYSQKEMTAESLGLSALPPAEAGIVLKVLRESIYMEPKFIAPQMAEYPFLAVSGFDGAIVDPKKPQNIFFEMNLGTPSGMSNNIELLEDLEKTDPEVFKAISPYLPAEKSFSLLRDTIERNARAWTKSSGISVVISPGIYNGAHPDVANIAKRSGMPLVKSSDLYEDANGNIRLNTGGRGQDPVVTGIYNRMEESFFFQSSSEGIPLISPQYENVGLGLRPGAIFKWIQDKDGKIVDVERDAAGNPVMVEVWDTIGRDPARPDAPRGSFLRAVLGRKLYVSNLGGRLVDDKRLFRIVSHYMAGKVAGGPARPVPGLSPENMSELFRDPDLFVVKEPANSGGVGIHFPRVMTAADKAALLERVRANPGAFEVQYVSRLATLPSASAEDFADVAIDLRIFVMMDDKGDVSAGANSMLLRTAPRGKLYSNTSRGGGYGIGVVLKPNETWWRWDRRNVNSYLPFAASDFDTAKNAMTLLRELHDEMTGLDDEDPDAEAMSKLKEKALAASFELRGLLHDLNGHALELPSRLREFSQNERADSNSLLQLVRALEQAFQSMRGAYGPLPNALLQMKREDAKWEDRLRRRLEDPTGLSYSQLNAKIKYRVLKDPVVSYYWDSGHDRHEKFEMAEIVKVEDPFIQKIIDDVKANGGEVRMMKTRILAGPQRAFVGWRYESPYFWVNLNPESSSFLKPVIGIDLTGDRGLAALAHEYEHFKIWLEHYKSKRAEGLDHEAAARAAVDFVWQRDMIVHGERMAVAAEMQAERDFPDSPFNQSRGMLRPKDFWEKGYLNRVTYPEFEAVRQVLHSHVWNKTELDMATLRKYMAEMIQRTLDTRAKALEYLGPAGDPRLREYWERNSISELLIYPYGIERLQQQNTLELFNQHLTEICKEITGDAVRCR